MATEGEPHHLVMETSALAVLAVLMACIPAVMLLMLYALLAMAVYRITGTEIPLGPARDATPKAAPFLWLAAAVGGSHAAASILIRGWHSDLMVYVLAWFFAGGVGEVIRRRLRQPRAPRW